jgi:uncharacterized protein (DUF885 family)
VFAAIRESTGKSTPDEAVARAVTTVRRAAFSLPAFHAAVLDHGSLPMPTLSRGIAAWLDAQSLAESDGA